MADKNNNNQRTPIKSGSSYSCEELRSLTMEDGTRVVYSADGDIKRPVCAGIDVHKEILMTAVCKTDTGTLKAVFYVRKFTTRNSDIRNMAILLKEHGVQDVCMKSTGKYWIPVFNILEQNNIKPILTHPNFHHHLCYRRRHGKACHNQTLRAVARGAPGGTPWKVV